MALLRLIHAAELPDPASLLARLSGQEGSAPIASPASSGGTTPTAKIPGDFRGLVSLLEANRKPLLAQQLHDHVSVVRYQPPELLLKPLRPLGGDWTRELAAALKTLTGTSWEVSLSDEQGDPSLLDQEKMAEERVRADVLADPNVRAVMDAFPDAELESFSVRGS
jgi:DNA polymerase-3 subunit gamma/tau